MSLVVVVAVAALLPAQGTAAAASTSVTITSPGAPVAGNLTLRGTVAAGTTSVVFAVDTSGSTNSPAGLDCDGDGTAGPSDDLNGDRSVGDTLDCEIGAVRAMAHTLAVSSGRSLVSLETFGSTAVPRDLDPSTTGDQLLVPADAAGSHGSLLETAVTGLRRDQVGTDFDPAVSTALKTLSGAPTGTKLVVLLTDGRAHAEQSTIDALAASGVRLRAFSIANADGCAASSALTALATATGERCRVVSSGAGLATALADAPPPAVTAVTVTVTGRSGSWVFPATVDLAGGWRLPLRMGAGSYTAAARATFSDGSSAAATRSFTVGRNDAAGLPDGVVQGAAARATDVVVSRPPSTLAALPSTVTGAVGTARAGQRPLATPALLGAVVQLQGRDGARWVTVGDARVGATGGFTLARGSTPATVDRLRVVLLPYQVYGSSVRTVPPPGISACRTTRSGTRFSVRCHTAAADGRAARLVRAGHVVRRTRVVGGTVTMGARGRPSSYVLAVKAGPGRWYRLHL